MDITQYIMIDRGRPLHVYDLAKLTGGLTARSAKPGEELLALNGKTYALDEGMVVIADDAKAHGFGGIMGGEESGCTETTTDVVIECAAFDPIRIGVTGRKLGLTSDARARFERGIDPAFIEPGMELATRMVLDICGGEASTVTKAGDVPVFNKTVTYLPSRTATLGGVPVEESEQEAVLTRLGFTVEAKGAEGWTIRVPSWRKDVDASADIVEEVLRLVGYDKIPSTPLPRAEGVARPTATAAQLRQRRARRAAASRGFQEAVTWSFISPADAAPFGGGVFTLDNPISADLAVMRPSLLPGLIAASGRNKARGATSIRLFEVGKRYLTEGERPTLALVATGEKQGRHWGAKAAGFDVYDAKAEALAVLEAAGAPVDRLQVTVDAPSWFHPGRSGTLRLDPRNPIAHFGELHPKVAKALDIKGTVVAVEIYLDAIPSPKAVKRARAKYAPSDLMPVSRDFAFVVKDDVEAGKLVQAVRGAEKQAITNVEVFDVFAGQGVEDGHKSVALAVTLQPGVASFTDADLEAISAKIVAAAGKVGATLRA